MAAHRERRCGASFVSSRPHGVHVLPRRSVLFVVASGAQAVDFETVATCGDVPFRIVTSCYEGSRGLFGGCASQRLVTSRSSWDMAGPAFESAGRLVMGQLASEFKCMPVGETQLSADTVFLLVRYYNGGNCSRCEWDELREVITGDVVASSQYSPKALAAALKEFRINPKRAKVVPIKRYAND